MIYIGFTFNLYDEFYIGNDCTFWIKGRSSNTEKHFFHLNSMLYKEVGTSNDTWKLKQSRLDIGQRNFDRSITLNCNVTSINFTKLILSNKFLII